MPPSVLVPLPKEKPPSAVFSFAYGDLQGLDDFSRSGKSSSAALRRCPERPCAPAKSLGRFRFDREKTRKAEISRDFSAFFAPNFFQISIDPFSIFLRVEGFELPKTHFFQNFITNESNTKDLNPRQGFILFRFFMLVTKCLQIVYYS